MGSPDEYGNPPVPYSGRVVVNDPNSDREGSVYMRHGRVYSVALDGFMPPIATRLHSGGMITDDQWEYLLSLEPQDVGPEAVIRGYATQDAVDDVHRQMILSSLTHLYGWARAPYWWDEDAETENFTIPGLETALMVMLADERMGQWDALARNYPQVTKSHAIPMVGPEWGAKEGEQTTPEMAAILRRVDGATSIARIANECGFTRFEIAARLAKAIADGVLIIPNPDKVSGSVEPVLAAEDPRRLAHAAALQRVEQARAALDAALADLAAIEETLPQG